MEDGPPPGGHELTERVWDSYGDEMTASGVRGVLRDWDAYRTAMLALLERFDLILAPVAPGPAPLHQYAAKYGADFDYRPPLEQYLNASMFRARPSSTHERHLRGQQSASPELVGAVVGLEAGRADELDRALDAREMLTIG